MEKSFNNEATESQTLLRRWVVLGGVKTRDARYLQVIFNGLQSITSAQKEHFCQ